MYDALLVRHCAPTLAGLKTGSLFSCLFPKPEEMRVCLLRWNRLLGKYGIRALPLRSRGGRTLIYVYLPHALLYDFDNAQTVHLLRERHYPLPCQERCIAHLTGRLNRSASFPHEIGLFLGYPPDDVRGFIDDPTAYKFSGCWKVYADALEAQRRFDAYRKCTQSYCTLFALGAGLEQLILPP